MSILTLTGPVTDHEVGRAVAVISRAPESSPAIAALYLRALTEFRAHRGITTPVTNADLAAAVGRRGACMAEQKDLAASWRLILTADLKRATSLDRQVDQ